VIVNNNYYVNISRINGSQRAIPSANLTEKYREALRRF